jgi:CubicO group peptidase (beta-lactamase class C family)
MSLHLRISVLPLSIVFSLLCSPLCLARTPSADEHTPKGIDWRPAEPQQSAVDPAALESIYSLMNEDPHRDLKGVVIVRNGHLVSERYFNGDSASSLHDIRSATKSITSLLMGIRHAARAFPVHPRR